MNNPRQRGYSPEVTRNNRARLDYVHRQTELEAERLPPEFCGEIIVKIPIWKGRFQRVSTTVTNVQPPDDPTE